MADQQLFLETALIRQAQQGNSAAYGELYTHHLAAIQHYIQKRIGEGGDAEDLAQTVFVKAWQALRDYQPSGAPFRAWLYRIAHNAVVDYYRTQRQSLFWDDLTELVDPEGTPEGRALATERQEIVRKAVAGLRPTYQAVVERRFLQELDYTETADELGQQINHVRVVQHRALEALRRVLVHDSVLWLTTAVAVMSLLLGGKIVVAAEQALPGDRLYTMRTWVEETRLLLADDATAVTLHTRFATQRITALDDLYQQGRSADLGAAIAAAAVHIRAASAQLTVVEQAERTRLAPQFAAALQTQAATLHDLESAAPQTIPALQPVLVALTAAQATLQPDHNNADDTAASQPMLTATPSATATRILMPTPAPTMAVGAPVLHRVSDDEKPAPSAAAPTLAAHSTVDQLSTPVAATDDTELPPTGEGERRSSPSATQSQHRPAADDTTSDMTSDTAEENTPLAGHPNAAHAVAEPATQTMAGEQQPIHTALAPAQSADDRNAIQSSEHDPSEHNTSSEHNAQALPMLSDSSASLDDRVEEPAQQAPVAADSNEQAETTRAQSDKDETASREHDHQPKTNR